MTTVAELRRLLADAGLPWKACGAHDGCGLVWSIPFDFPVATTDTDSEDEGFSTTRDGKIAGAEFIATGLSALPLLLDVVEAADALARVTTHANVRGPRYNERRDYYATLRSALSDPT